MSATFEEVDEFLAHHGIIGMHWGVRKEQERIADQNVQNYRAGIIKRQPIHSKPITKADYDKLSKEPVKVADANSTLYRVTGSPSVALSNVTYVTQSKEDNSKYVALLAPKGNIKSDKYQLTLSTSKDLISPSKRTRIDTFISTLNDDIPLPNSRQTVKGRAYMESDPVAKSLSSFELGLKTYNQFAQSQVFNTPLHTAYFNKLRAAGYNSLVDDADKGLVTDTPVIIFPDLSGAKVTSVTKLSKDDVLNAQLNLR